MSFNSDALSVKVEGAIREALLAHKDQIIESSGGIFARQGMKIAFPILLDQSGNLAEVAIEVIRKEFGELNVNDLLNWLATK
jgi:hypothetical protein